MDPKVATLRSAGGTFSIASSSQWRGPFRIAISAPCSEAIWVVSSLSQESWGHSFNPRLFQTSATKPFSMPRTRKTSP